MPSVRFSATLSWPTSGNSWETMATPAAWLAMGEPGCTGSPLMTTSPPGSGVTVPARMPSMVDLPAPFSPTMPVTSPLRKVSSSTWRTVARPYVLDTRRRETPAAFPCDTWLAADSVTAT